MVIRLLEQCSSVKIDVLLLPSRLEWPANPVSAKAKGRTTLTREDVIAATQRLLDRAGADALSMRILARELSVSVSTLYWHVRDKRELLKLMIDDSLSAVQVPTVGDWKHRLAEFLRQGRNVLRARPVLIGLIWGSGWELGPQTLRVTNDVVGLVAESGVPERRSRRRVFHGGRVPVRFRRDGDAIARYAGLRRIPRRSRRDGAASRALSSGRRPRQHGTPLRARHCENRQQPRPSP